jgi:hypothetical protein
MPDETPAAPEQHAEREKAGPAPAGQNQEQKREEEEVGDFITRHVLEKDSVFFEG